MTEATTDETEQCEINTSMGRRAFCVGTVGTIAIAGVGTVAADEVLDHENEAIPNPAISATVTKETHEPGFDALRYFDDSMEEADLPAELDDSDGEDVYTMRADRIDASDYRTMPRGVEEEDGDDDVPVSAIDADRWSGDLDVAEGDTDIDSVQFSGEGSATFDADGELSIDSDPRNYVQLGVNVDELEGSVEIKALDDDGGEVVVSIDPDGDDSDKETVATDTGSGIVYQEQVGELPEADADEITELEVEIDGDADVTIFALNLERASRWEFGETVVQDEDGDDETETIRSPSGEFTLTDLDGDLVEDAVVYDLEMPVVYDAANAEIETDHRLEETERYPPYDALSTTVSRLEVPTAYELDHSDLALELEQEMGGDRYSVVEIGEDTSDTDDNDDIEWSTQTDQLEGEDETATLEDLVETGTEYAVRVEMKLTDGETDGLYTAAGGGAGATGSSGGLMNWVLTIGASIAGFIGIRRFTGGDGGSA